MRIKVVTGKYTDKNIHRCYDYLIKRYKEELERDSDIREGIDGRARKERVQCPQSDTNVQGQSRNK